MKEHDFERIVPPSIARDPAVKARFDELCNAIQGFYNDMTEAGIPAEDARYILPNATETKIVVTMNARSLLHFFELRCCSRAQWEIRELANRMLEEVRQVAPVLFAKAGPTCVTQRVCHEGKMSCGRLKQLLAEDEAKKK